jgi:DNA-damage-inducible protein J
MTSVHFRTDDKIKKRAQAILKKLGLDLSTALNMYLHQIVLNEGMPSAHCPHPVCFGGHISPKLDKQLWEEEQEALKSGKVFRNVDELFASWDHEK